jgi:hypothetical protein
MNTTAAINADLAACPTGKAMAAQGAPTIARYTCS